MDRSNPLTRILIILFGGVVLFGLLSAGLLVYLLFFDSEEALPKAVLKPTATDLPGKIVFEDDFSTVTSGWPRLEDANGVTDYVLDSYHILVKKPEMYLWATPKLSMPDVILEVKVKVLSSVGGDVGLICRYRDAQNFYAFVIANDGYFAINKYIDGKRSLVGMNQYRKNVVIGTAGSLNILRAECIGRRLRFYANGGLLAEVFDSDLIMGDVGLIAGTYELGDLNVQYDDFVMRQP